MLVCGFIINSIKSTICMRHVVRMPNGSHGSLRRSCCLEQRPAGTEACSESRTAPAQQNQTERRTFSYGEKLNRLLRSLIKQTKHTLCFCCAQTDFAEQLILPKIIARIDNIVIFWQFSTNIVTLTLMQVHPPVLNPLELKHFKHLE